MKRNYTFFTGLIALCCTLFSVALHAQNCSYVLQMVDFGGNGWNGADVVITVDGVPNIYTLVNGDANDVFFDVTDGDAIEVEFIAGFADFDVVYGILDANGDVVFADGPGPATGDVFTGTIECPACQSVPASTVTFTEIKAFTADVNWFPISNFESYLVEVGPDGFMPGTGTVTSYPTNDVILTGLDQNTLYDMYLSVACMGGDTSTVVGPFSFQTLWANDVGISGFINPNPGTDCFLSDSEVVEIAITNYGGNPQSLIPFKYSVNGVDASIPFPEDGYYTGVISTDSTAIIPFETLAALNIVGPITIKAWTELENDAVPENDTLTLTFSTTYAFPFMEDFEDLMLPEGWISSDIFNIANAHNAGSVVIYDNIYSGDPNFELTTNNYGLVNDGDSLFFEYRYTLWSAGDVPFTFGPNDKLEIQASTDCGISFTTVETIDENNHIESDTMQVYSVDMSEFAGESITIKFVATWGMGDYWFDLDNINMMSCPADFAVMEEIVDATPNDTNGSVTITPTAGLPPYTYLWDTGETSNVLTDVAGGLYDVTITDSNDCENVLSVLVQESVAVEDIDGLTELLIAPNPANNYVGLSMEFITAKEVEVVLVNALGKRMTSLDFGTTNKVNHQIDLTNLSAGLYFVQIIADRQIHTEKLMITK